MKQTLDMSMHCWSWFAINPSLQIMFPMVRFIVPNIRGEKC